MIKITFYTQNNHYVGLKCLGHANYDEYGKDIICASVSSITQNLALGILNVLNIKASYEVDEDAGKLNLRLPDNIEKVKSGDVELLFEVTYQSLLDLEKGYPNNIKVEVKDLCL